MFLLNQGAQGVALAAIPRDDIMRVHVREGVLVGVNREVKVWFQGLLVLLVLLD